MDILLTVTPHTYEQNTSQGNKTSGLETSVHLK